MKEKDKHVLVSSDYFVEFESISKQYNLSNKALFQAMISYFKATKKDPRIVKDIDLNDEIKLVNKRISDMDKHIISFIKTQEKEILKPVRSQINDLHTAILIKLGYEIDDLKTDIRTFDVVTEDINNDFARLFELFEKNNDYSTLAQIKYGLLPQINGIISDYNKHGK